MGPESALTSAVETTPSEYIFNVRTPADPENDGWDQHSHSWQQGDELGLAVTTADGFTFPFSNENNPPTDLATAQNVCQPPALFQPVKLQSLTEPQSGAAIPTQLKAKLPSEASIDSGYGSTHSRNRFAPTTAGMPVAAHGGWIPQPAAPAVGESEDEVFAMFNEPVPDSQINYSALEMSFAEFTDPAAWDAGQEF